MIYLDYNATTPLSENVKKCIQDNMELFVNPSSTYREGKIIKRKIEDARNSVSKIINAKAEKVIFTGCATESNNSVISSCLNNSQFLKSHIIVSSVEHSAIFETVKFYEKYRNLEVTYLPVDQYGRINLDDVKTAIRDNTILVSVMLVNNEIGNIYPIKEITKLVKSINNEIMVHTDATQAIGKMKVDVEDLGIDYLTLSGHKFYGPKGIGALYVKNPKNFLPYIIGGHQESGKRAGTENLLSILAIGQAAKDIMDFNDYIGMEEKRNCFEEKVLKFIKGSKIIGDIENRVCNTSCILIDNLSGIDICEFVNEFDDVCISSGSACNSIMLEPSHVMFALGINAIPIRISIGKDTTSEELTKCVQSLIKAHRRLNKK